MLAQHAPDLSYMPQQYWARRSHYAYYARVRRYLESLGQQGSIMDVGCWDTPVATWGSFRERHTCELVRTPRLPGVSAYVGSFMGLKVAAPFDVITCLQVLEHMELDEAKEFGRKLRKDSRRTVVSVPHRWPAGREPSHKLDPIDHRTLREIMGAVPEASEVTDEGASSRLIAIYEQ